MKPLTKIQKFAKGKACQLRIPGICRTTPENQDCVLCHAPHPNRGGMRKDDHWGAVGCVPCHDVVDRRNQKSYAYGDCTNTDAELAHYWMPAVYEWQAMLIQEGLMKVEGIEPGLPKILPRNG